ncbi:MAG: hypothetical protein OXK78_06710 [Caldilineaceae bacterium]|nr:hypothetical protein [Caldilineaceae bacterium]
MSDDTNRSGQDASGHAEHSEDAVVDALGHILSQSEAARSALATTLREGGTAVGTIAGVRSEDVVVEGERPSLAGLDEEGVVRVLVQPLVWAGLSQGQPNAYFKGLPLDRPAALLFVAPAARLARLWPELCRRADEQFTIIGATTPGDLRAATVSGGERRLMLTSWDALLGFMGTVVSGVGDGDAEIGVGQLRELIDRMDAETCWP